MKAKFSAVVYLYLIVFGVLLSGCELGPRRSTPPVILIPANSAESQSDPIQTESISLATIECIAQNTVAEPTKVVPSHPQKVGNIPAQNYRFNPNPVIEQTYATDKMNQDLDSLMKTVLPARDYLKNHVNLTAMSWPEPNQPAVWSLGQHRNLNVEGDKVEVRLAAAGTNAYMWVDTRLALSDEQFIPIVNRLDNDLYPTMRSIFGQEQRPGIDGDIRFHIIHLARLNNTHLGYFDSSDLYPPEVFAESNELEGVFINLETITLGDDVYYGTLVHEIQHLIQWGIDRNEENWPDEGLSQLAEIRTGFNSLSVDSYIQNNDIQLNNWSYEPERYYRHYGGSALFLTYLWEQLGDEFIQNLSARESDGMPAVSDSWNQVGSEHTLKTLFRDWLIAVYLNDPTQAEAKYGFSQYEFEPPIAHQIVATNGSTFSDLQSRSQFSGWYVGLPREQTVTISFAGDSFQSLFPLPPNSPDGYPGTAFYAPPGNRLDLTLQKAVNLSGVANPMISFDAWYDYAHLMVSADGGQNWEALFSSEMKQGTYGHGFSDKSNGWISQIASLEKWRGQQVIAQFKVLTDSAVPRHGFAVDNITITGEPTIADFEFDNGGWEANGFVRTGNSIPQLWTVSVAQKLPSGEVQVQDLMVDRYGEAQQMVSIAEEGVLIIAPISPMTTDKAEFWFQIE